jgi:alkanesulfonate monooxygenase
MTLAANANALGSHVGAWRHPMDGLLPPLDPGQVDGTHIGVAIATREGLSIRETARRILPQMGGNRVMGMPHRIADAMEHWYRAGACDGFMAAAPPVPTGLERVAAPAVPELRQRGLFRAAYPGTKLRDTLGLQRPTNPHFAE